MPVPTRYQRQFGLLLRVLPIVAREKNLALYGGTAINLFLHDLPRISVDLDLRYLRAQDYAVASKCIEACLERIVVQVKKIQPDCRHRLEAHKLRIRSPGQNAEIKLEVNPVFRGEIFGIENRQLAQGVVQKYGCQQFVMQLLSAVEIYASKIKAMLSRTNARDLHDVQLLGLHNWQNRQMWKALVIFMLMDENNAIHHMFDCNRIAISDNDYRNFSLMLQGRQDQVTKHRLEQAGRQVCQDIVANMPQEHKKLLIDAFDGRPDFAALDIDIKNLPGLAWRMEQIKAMTQTGRQQIVRKLAKVLQVL